MRHHILAAACAALMLLGAACTSQKTATTAATGSSTTATAESSPLQRYEAMTATYGLWHDVQMPVRATLRSPMSLSASGRLTMVRDSLVHLSMRVLGMEVAVVRITPDSLHVLDKFHRYMLAESTRQFTARTGLTLADVQCALMGRAFVPGAGAATARMASGFKLSGTGDAPLTILPAKAPAAYDWSMTATTLPDGRVALTSLSVQPKGRSAATCSYTPAGALTPAGAMASALDMQASMAGKKLDATLRLTLDDARWNTHTSPALPSLRGYERIPLSSLPRMLQLF